MNGWICSAKIFEYKNVVFEYPFYGPPVPLKKDGEPKKRVGKKFWDLFSEFAKLPEKDQNKYRIGGGCQRF